IRPTHGEPDEAFGPSRRRQPLAHFFVVFSTTKNDAADFVPSVAARRRHDLFAVRTPIESLDLPDIRFDARVLQLLDRLNHQLGTKFQVVNLPVPSEPVELRLLRGHKQLKHEAALTVAAK